MESLLVLRHVVVQNANAISGFTWGFPAVTHFLGFVHALSRSTVHQWGAKLGGCVIACHETQAHTHKFHEHVFSQTRNPLTKQGDTAPFNEEGKMHLEVSLVIACDFDPEDLDPDSDASLDEKVAAFERQIYHQVMRQRLAGGNIESVEKVEFISLEESHESRRAQERRILYSLLPGFVLADRSHVFAEDLKASQEADAQVESLDCWLDFIKVQHECHVEKRPDEDKEHIVWKSISKPAEGWLVPIQVGYKGISPLYQPGEIQMTRDCSVPFRFVEAVHGIGEWLGAHRIQSVSGAMWDYHHDEEWYICKSLSECKSS
ncbi:MAG: type I-F CRISPR-associated protein Csy2 [Chlamydiia bacterium]|nr:type I-F CRISPR-associated protein Csy2 [Chlamydiia bacterium]